MIALVVHLTVVWAIGCRVPEEPVDGTGFPPSQGIVLGLRTPEGDADLVGRAAIGTSGLASPDASGFVFYVDVPPGRTPVKYARDDASVAFSGPEVFPDAMSTVAFVPTALTPIDGVDPSGPVDLQFGDYAVTGPAGGWNVDQVPIDAPFTVGWRAIGAAERAAVPGDGLGITGDDEVHEVVLDSIVAVRAWNDDGDVTFGGEDEAGEPLKLSVVATLPAGSPLLAPDADVRLYVYGFTRTYWVLSGFPTVDAASRTATFEVGSVGWWALGRVAPARGCVRGRVVTGGGAGLVGAEVRLFDPAYLSTERMNVRDGGFCLPVSAGASVALDVLGVDAARTALYTGQASATSGAVGSCATAGCVDVGDVVVETWLDADGDLSWAGPGGDCDDADPDVNPNPTLGDGSYCGGAL